MSTTIKNLNKYVEEIADNLNLSKKKSDKFKLVYHHIEYDKDLNLVKDEYKNIDSLSVGDDNETIILG